MVNFMTSKNAQTVLYMCLANGAGSIKAKRTTSIAAPSSLSILPLAPSRSLAKSASPEEPEEPEYNPEPPPQEMTSEEVEAEVLCNQLESQLRGTPFATNALSVLHRGRQR